MKKPRDVTAEEKRLWREVTRHDEKYRDETALQEDPWVLSSESSFLRSQGSQATGDADKSPSVALDSRLRGNDKTNHLPILSGRDATRLLKPYGAPEATLDLHGLGRVEAYTRVSDFLARSRRAGLRHVVIITGKGRTGEGILRRQLPLWLNEPALRMAVIGIAYAPANKGGSGVLHVVLKRPR
jgi:DNA-nicking Smr family endonuclease